MIVGVVGFLGSGKGTIGDLLIQDRGYYKLSFADAVKDSVSTIFRWPRHLLEGDTEESRNFRETTDGFWSERFGYAVTPRYMLQLMGTEAGRDVFHENIWVYTLEKRMEGLKDVVIPDVRFPNEMKFIKDKGGIIIRVLRGELPKWYDVAIAANDKLFLHSPEAHDMMINKYKVHYSEWAWVGAKHIDYTILNDGTIEDLKIGLNNIMGNIK